MPNLLLQTTIEGDHDDWHIERFSLLKAYLLSLRDEDGRFAFQVTARNRTKRGEPDPVLSKLHETEFDQLWLFAVDVGDGLTPQDCEGIGRFRRRGGSLMATRDHMDLGSSICNLGGVGAAHHFHSLNCEPDEERHCVDNPFAANISWPNYHSGANGDYQRVRAVGSVHPVMQDQEAANGVIQYLPSHPHEGAVSAPLDDPSARAVMDGAELGVRPALQPGGRLRALRAGRTGDRAIDLSSLRRLQLGPFCGRSLLRVGTRRRRHRPVPRGASLDEAVRPQPGLLARRLTPRLPALPRRR